MNMKFTKKNNLKGPTLLLPLLGALVTVLFLGIGCNSVVVPDANTERPNIVFFIADDMYPEMFNFLPEGEGKNLTPNIDRLAREGTIMMNQYVASPVCTPSRYNVLAGNYASRARNTEFLKRTISEEGQTVIDWNPFITSEDKILTSYLKELGYVTGFVGKNHVIEGEEMYTFPDYQADARDPEIARLVNENYRKAEQAVLDSDFDYAGGIYHNNPNILGLADLAVQNMDWIAQAGEQFIEQHHEQPFFLYYATTIPHGPNTPERSWKANPLVTAAGYLDEVPNVLPSRDSLNVRIKEAGLEGNFKELVLWLDDAVGALLNKLEEKGVLNNTIIFFFNDHGQHGKATLYQGGVLNPSIVWRSGGFKVGNISESRISNIDFAPTILELAGMRDVDDHFDGKSFKAVLDSTSNASRESLYFEIGYARAVIKGDFKYYALRYPEYARNWTLDERKSALEAYNETRRFRNMMMANEDDPTMPFSHMDLIPGGSTAGLHNYGKRPGYFDLDQLYNLAEDPNEMSNLAKDPNYAAKLAEMKMELQHYIDDLPGKFDL
jgi:arylsulfatase A-like enzyme